MTACWLADDGRCSQFYAARGLCRRHYAQMHGARRLHQFASPARLVPPPVPPVCVCDEPLNVSAFGECQACFRPYRQETFAATRAAWRSHLGFPPDAANARGKGPAVPPPAGPTLE